MSLYSIASAQMPGNMSMPKKENNQPAAKVIYTCVMHPEVQMSKPGKCPKCGMALVKKTIKTAKPSAKPSNKEAMQMPEDTSQKEPMKMGNMQMDKSKKPKAAVRKTIVNNIPPKTVRYDLNRLDLVKFLQDEIAARKNEALHQI